MHALVLFLALIFAPAQQGTLTIRDCILRTGYTRAVHGVVDDSGYRLYMDSPLAQHDLLALLDAPSVSVPNDQVSVILNAMQREGYTPVNYATLMFQAEGTGKQAPQDSDPTVARMRQHYMELYGENRKVWFIVLSPAEIYAFVFMHPYEPGALEPGAWHGSCMLRLNP